MISILVGVSTTEGTATMNPTLVIASVVAAGMMAVVLFQTKDTMIHNVISKIRQQQKVKRLLLSYQDSSSSLSSKETTKMVVQDLYIYPVKSLRAVSLSKAVLDDKGFEHDRQFMIVTPLPTPAWGSFLPTDSTHKFLTQRQCPILATITATLDSSNDDSRFLTLSWKNADNTELSMRVSCEPPRPINTIRARIWSDQVHVDDMGDEVASFLQSIINQEVNCSTDDEGHDATNNKSTIAFPNVRLVSHSQRTDRQWDTTYAPPLAKTWLGNGTPVSLNDGYPILIACSSSLNALNERLQANGKEPILMNRFRPNVVIHGTIPFEEDKWKVIAIGTQCFAIVKACPRCKQSCTDQQTGQVYSEPLETMKSFRALGIDGGDVFFAQNAIPIGTIGVGSGSGGSTIQIGDPVRVLEWGEPVYH